MGKDILGIFDGADIEGMAALIDKLEKSSFDYMKLEGDGVSITIGKNGVCDIGEPQATFTSSNAPVAVNAVSAAPAQAVYAAADVVYAEAVKETIPEQEGVFVIKAPSQCRFYAQPEPGAAPYVSVGAAVKAGDTVGLMEIMKTFSAITSTVNGEVVAIHVINEEYLETDQPVISIKVN